MSRMNKIVLAIAIITAVVIILCHPAVLSDMP